MFRVENFTMICLVLPGALFPSLCDTALSVGCNGGSNSMALHTSRILLSVLSWAGFSGMPEKRRLSRLSCCSSWSSSERRSTTAFFSSEISLSLWMICYFSGCSWRCSSAENMSLSSSWVGLVMSFKRFWISGHFNASVKHRAKWSGDMDMAEEQVE